MVQEAVDRAKTERENGSVLTDDNQSVLEKLILKCGPESKIPLVTAFDMVGAGIDTTSNMSGFLFYSLAANPDKQEKLREEINSFDKKITEKSLNQMRYLKAVFKENARLFPLVIAGGRLVPNEFEIRGYHIPPNTSCMWFVTHMAMDPKRIKDPQK